MEEQIRQGNPSKEKCRNLSGNNGRSKLKMYNTLMERILLFRCEMKRKINGKENNKVPSSQKIHESVLAIHCVNRRI